MFQKRSTSQVSFSKKSASVLVAVVMAASGSIMVTQAEAKPKYGCATGSSYKTTLNSKPRTCSAAQIQESRKYYPGNKKQRVNPDRSRGTDTTKKSQVKQPLVKQMQTKRMR